MITSDNILFLISVLGSIFAVYLYFRNPQVAIDKKAALLAQEIGLRDNSVDSRFMQMQTDIKESYTLAQNHMHTVDTKIDVLSEQVVLLGKEVVRLSTIIDERIPKQMIPAPQYVK